MNIFHKVALQGLVKSRTRTLVTIIGVALSAALITAVATFAVSLQAYMINGAREKYGSWHVSFPSADASFLRKQAAGSRVADVVSFENIGYAMLEAKIQTNLTCFLRDLMIKHLINCRLNLFPAGFRKIAVRF